MINTREEFEIYKTAEIIASGSDPDIGENLESPVCPNPESHDGGNQCQQACTADPVGMEDAGSRMGQIGGQGALPDGKGIGIATTVVEAGQSRGEPVASPSIDGHPIRDGRRECGRIGDDRQFPVGESKPFSDDATEESGIRSTTEPIVFISGNQREELPDGRGHRTHGDTANVPTPSTMCVVDDPEGREQPRKDVLEVFRESRVPVRNVHLDPVSTTLEPTTRSTGQSRITESIGAGHDAGYTDAATQEMPTHQDKSVRDERLRGEGEVPGLRQAPVEPSSTQCQDEGIQVQSIIGQDEQPEIQLLDGDRRREQQDIGNRDGGVQDAPGVLQVEEGPPGPRTELRDSMRTEIKETYGDATNRLWNKHERKL